MTNTTLNRDEVRAAIFKGTVLRRVPITFNGMALELLQPTITEVSIMYSPENKQNSVARSLIFMAVIPGTDTKVFDETDLDALSETPYSQEITAIQKAIASLLDGVSVQESIKN